MSQEKNSEPGSRRNELDRQSAAGQVRTGSLNREQRASLTPDRIWLFQLPDGHWEVRWERPEVPATEYVKVRLS